MNIKVINQQGFKIAKKLSSSTKLDIKCYLPLRSPRETRPLVEIFQVEALKLRQ
jgi:hypothetical protein